MCTEMIQSMTNIRCEKKNKLLTFNKKTSKIQETVSVDFLS